MNAPLPSVSHQMYTLEVLFSWSSRELSAEPLNRVSFGDQPPGDLQRDDLSPSGPRVAGTPPVKDQDPQVRPRTPLPKRAKDQPQLP